MAFSVHKKSTCNTKWRIEELRYILSVVLVKKTEGTMYRVMHCVVLIPKNATISSSPVINAVCFHYFQL